jgi:hypothetical protein
MKTRNQHCKITANKKKDFQYTPDLGSVSKFDGV